MTAKNRKQYEKITSVSTVFCHTYLTDSKVDLAPKALGNCTDGGIHVGTIGTDIFAFLLGLLHAHSSY